MLNLLFVLIFAFFLFFIGKRLIHQPAELKIFFWPGMIFRILAGWAVGYLYFFHYGEGDTISYWADGNSIADFIVRDPWNALKFYLDFNPDVVPEIINDQSRSLFFVKITGMLSLLAWGNYGLMSAMLSCISFFSAWYLINRIHFVFPKAWPAAVVSFLFFPSVSFWSSGLIKESLGMSSLFFLTGVFLAWYGTLSTVDVERRWNQKIKWWEWVLCLVALWTGWNLKYYWVGVFFPAIITTVITISLTRLVPFLVKMNLIIWVAMFFVLLLAATRIHPNFYAERIAEVIVQNNDEFMKLSDPGNTVRYQDLQPNWSSIGSNAPQALVAGFFRPFIWETQNAMSILAAMENFILLLFTITALPLAGRLFKSPHRLLGLAVLVYSVALSILLALSTPNFGTLSRYKIGFIPFFVFLVLFDHPLLRRLKLTR